MAKFKAKHSKSLALRPTVRPIVIRTPTPIVKVKKSAKHKGHRGGGGGIAGFLNHRRTQLMIGAFAVGVLEKQGIMSQLPALPFIGRTGTIGFAAHMLAGGKAGLADDVATAALVIASHELGSTGSIVGGDGGGGGYDPVNYVSGY